MMRIYLQCQWFDSWEGFSWLYLRCATRSMGGYLLYQKMTILELKACIYRPGSNYLW